MNEDTGVNEATREIIIWAGGKQIYFLKRCNIGHGRYVYAHVHSKQEATILFRKVRESEACWVSGCIGCLPFPSCFPGLCFLRAKLSELLN